MKGIVRLLEKEKVRLTQARSNKVAVECAT